MTLSEARSILDRMNIDGFDDEIEDAIMLAIKALGALDMMFEVMPFSDSFAHQHALPRSCGSLYTGEAA